MSYIWILSSGGMILTEENQSIWRKTSPISNNSTTNPMWTGVESNPCPCSER